MEPMQGKRKKRGRWLIAAGLLFVAAAVSWWYWPRGDSRFVGQWIAAEPGSGTVSRRFDATGYTGSSVRSIGADGKTLVGRASHERWRVNGDVLVLTTSYGDGVGGVWRFLKAKVHQRMNSVAPFEARYRILEITARSLRLQRISDPANKSTEPVETYLKIGPSLHSNER